MLTYISRSLESDTVGVPCHRSASMWGLVTKCKIYFRENNFVILTIQEDCLHFCRTHIQSDKNHTALKLRHIDVGLSFMRPLTCAPLRYGGYLLQWRQNGRDSTSTSLTIVYSTVCSDADERKHQSPASLAFVWGIHRGPVNSPHKWPVTRKMFPLDDVIV